MMIGMTSHNLRQQMPVSATLLSRRGWACIGLAFIGLGLVTLMSSDLAGRNAWWLHGTWCIAAFVFTLPVLVRTVRVGALIVLRDHLVMFTGAFALYFVFGASLLAFGPEQQIAATLSYYPVDAPEALRADAVNAIGFGIALLVGAMSSRRFFASQAERVSAVANRVPVFTATLILAAIGVVASIYTISFDIGLNRGVISGVWRSLGEFSLAAIYLGSSYHGRRERLLRVLAIAMALLLSISGLLLFSKTGILLPLAALFAGLSVRYRSRKMLLAGLAVMGLVFVAIAGVTNYGRINLGSAIGDQYNLRQAVISNGFSARDAGAQSTQYNTWARFCYIAAQTAAMDFYDKGRGGHELGLIPWVFVPRALATGKPSITRPGVELSIKISGNSHSSTGQGIFSSGYYNLGWVGVLLASLICGWLLAQTSAVANAILLRNAALLFPLALLGVMMAFRIDGHFIADYIGAFVFILYPLLGASLLISIQRGRI